MSPVAVWLEANQRTQVWLAQELGISVATMSRIARGITMPRPLLAEKIQRKTGVSVAALNRAKAARTPLNRAARVRHAKNLITRGSAMLAAVTKESEG